MTLQTELSTFGAVVVFMLLALVFVGIGLFLSKLIRPHRPDDQKLSTYECGEQAEGVGGMQFNARFFIIALVFVLFEAELIFLFPWAIVFGKKELLETSNGVWGWFALAEMGIFLLILTLGLVYAWGKGYLDWVKPQTYASPYNSKVPMEEYEAFNSR